jgi:hypothetical protein
MSKYSLDIHGSFFMFLMICGCDSPEDYRRAAIETASSGATSVPYAVEMERQFDRTDHFIGSFKAGTSGDFDWQSISYFGGRYELVMEAPVKIDGTRRQVLSCGIPKFWLHEVSSIDPSNHAAWFSKQWEFGPEEWEKLLDSGMDWKSIGIELRDDEVAGFEGYVNAWRRNIPEVKLVPPVEP